MMQILAETSKKLSKKVTCLGVLPLKFEGERWLTSFNQLWGIINEVADEAILFDLENSEFFKKTEFQLSKLDSIKRSGVLNIVVDMERQFEKIEYPRRR